MTPHRYRARFSCNDLRLEPSLLTSPWSLIDEKKNTCSWKQTRLSTNEESSFSPQPQELAHDATWQATVGKERVVCALLRAVGDAYIGIEVKDCLGP